MPKKTARRSPARSRPRRPAPRSQGQSVGNAASPADDGAVVSATVVSTVATSAPSAAPTPSRRASTNRRAAVAVVDYSYLRRDITALAVLAPIMIVAVVIASFVFHY